jgi:class 3 adenylate cyclase
MMVGCPVSDVRVGDWLANYRLVSVLGRGGMGVVYLAEDERLGRQVAVKVMAPELAADDEYRLRFLRESLLAASLEHPHVIPIHEAGEGDGTVFLAMRYVEGSDLRAMLLRDGRLAPQRAVALVGQVASALDAAHARGLVHRDVKPGNVLVAGGVGGADHAYLCDFGLAKQTGSQGGLSAATSMVGTLEYMAPEQIRGEPTDGRTDVYALSCVLYQLLTGTVPYQGTEAAVLWAHIQGSPPSPHTTNPDLPRSLDAVIAAGLAKNPDQRYQSCGELAEAAATSLDEPGGGDRSKGGEEVRPIDVEPAVAAVTPSARPAEATRLERRVISALFVDISARLRGLDVEDMAALTGRLHDLVGEKVKRFGGLVCKPVGDGLLAIFGAPVAHEDDPERAVRAAIAIRQQMRDDASGDIRVGVTTGEGLVSYRPPGDMDAIGDIVNAASRLTSIQLEGEIRVDEPTRRATNPAIRYQSAADTSTAEAAPVEVWIALEPRSIVPEQARVGNLRLVGRRRERNLLVEALERSRGDPSTLLVSIIGEPGIGKTRLVEELFEHVGQSADLTTWRRGRSLSYGEGVAFWALGEMVKQQAAILESDSAPIAEAKLSDTVRALIEDERDREWVTRHLRPLVGLEARISVSVEGGRVEAFAAWRRFFEALAEARPTVLMFEDIHWADDALLDFIDLLADRAGALPLLLVCTARSELLDRRKRWAGGKTNALTISLAPLANEDTARLVRELLDQPSLPDELVKAVLDRAEGNPLYAQEYLRMLQDRDLLVQGDAGWALADSVDGVPGAVQSIIAARLDTLSANEKMLIQDAAVIGNTAWIGACRALTERADWEAEELLHQLERKQLLQRTRRSSIDGEIEFRFSHALTQEVAYSQIRRLDRAQKHEAAAGWIERLAGQRDDTAELLADHYHQALELLRAAGQETSSLAPRAQAAFARAARRAADVHAHTAAARHYHAALELTPRRDPGRAALVLGETAALFRAKMADEHTLQAAIDTQVTAEDWEAAAELQRMLFWWHNTYDPNHALDAQLALAEEYASRVPMCEIACQIAGDRAIRMILSNQASAALALTRAMLPAAEEASLTLGHAMLLHWRGVARAELGDPAGLDDMRTATATLARDGHSSTPSAYFQLANCVRGFGDMRAANTAYGTAASWHDRLGGPLDAEAIMAEQAYQAYHAGRWRDAEPAWTQIDTANLVVFNLWRVTRGRLSVARGRIDEASDDGDAILAYGEVSGDRDFAYYGLALQVLCHTAAGRHTVALETCRRFLVRWLDTRGPPSRAIELGEIVSTMAAAGHYQEISDAAILLPEACRWRDPLLAMADQRYADAAELYEEIGSRPLAADAHLLAGRQAADDNRAADAWRHAEAVTDFAKATGASLYLRRAQEFVGESA